MKFSIKAFLFVALGLSLTHCKQVQFDADGDVVVTGDKSDLSSITYFDGGWFGPWPNYRVKMKMNLYSDGSLKLSIDRPACQVTARGEAQDFYELAEMIEYSTKIKVQGPGAIDGGQENVTVEDTFGNSDVYEMTRPEFVSNDRKESLVITHPEEIRAKINAILDQHPCPPDRPFERPVTVIDYNH